MLAAELINPRTAAVVRSYAQRVRGSGRILNAVDAIAGDLRRDLGESLYPAHAASRPLPRVTTASLAALQDYADGEARWRAGRLAAAVALYRAALAADPGFAMARTALASADRSYIYNDPADCRAEYQWALARPERLTARELMAIRANRAADSGQAAAGAERREPSVGDGLHARRARAGRPVADPGRGGQLQPRMPGH